MKKHFSPLFVCALPVLLLIMNLTAPRARGQVAGCTDQALQLAEGQLIDPRRKS
jgi:hypothetical protein